ncbi:hypothetical protein ACP4OV_014094 [Aristida adscensionis]
MKNPRRRWPVSAAAMTPNASCVHLTEAARSVKVFRINGFTATKETSGCVASTVWTVGGLDWRINLYPNTSEGYYGDRCWVMLRVTLISNASGVAASFSCRVLDQDSSTSSWQRRSPETIVSSTFHQNKSEDVRLTRRQDLEGSAYLKDECILVECAITVLLGGPKNAAAAKAKADVEAAGDLQKHLGELLRSQRASDVTFLVSGERVAAHRCVLAARSPVFMAELCGGMREKASPCVEVEDMEAEVSRAMLHFIYTDTLPPELEHDGDHAAATAAQHLLEAADRYGLERLKGLCAEVVCAGVTVETAAATLALAEQHGCAELKARCMEFVLATPANFRAVAATEG